MEPWQGALVPHARGVSAWKPPKRTERRKNFHKAKKKEETKIHGSANSKAEKTEFLFTSGTRLSCGPKNPLHLVFETSQKPTDEGNSSKVQDGKGKTKGRPRGCTPDTTPRQERLKRDWEAMRTGEENAEKEGGSLRILREPSAGALDYAKPVLSNADGDEKVSI